MRNRWKCGHCGASGWGAMPSHDDFFGRPCRKSGAKPEAKIKAALSAEYRLASRHNPAPVQPDNKGA